MPVSVESAFLWQYFAGRNYPCPRCGYNLRDLAKGRCPECGSWLFIQVGTSELPQELLLFGLMGLSIAAGIDGLILLTVLVFSVIERRMPNFEHDLFVRAAGLVVSGLFPACWLVDWERIRRQSRKKRWMLASLCWTATAVNCVLLILSNK